LDRDFARFTGVHRRAKGTPTQWEIPKSEGPYKGKATLVKLRRFHMFIPTVGHQHFETCKGVRHLMFGPIVPEGEIWTLLLLAAKNNGNPEYYLTGESVADEASVCICVPPRPSNHEEVPPSTWVLLEGKIDMRQYESVKWEGALELREGTQLGAWFRGAREGDSLEFNAVWDVEVLAETETERYYGTITRVGSSWHEW